MRAIAVFILICLLCIPVFALPLYAADEGFDFRKDADLEAVRPGKPARVKLRRSEDGRYIWEINGDNVDEILAVDRKLRRQLGVVNAPHGKSRLP